MGIKPPGRAGSRVTPPAHALPLVSSPLLIEETARVVRALIVDGTLEPGRACPSATSEAVWASRAHRFAKLCDCSRASAWWRCFRGEARAWRSSIRRSWRMCIPSSPAWSVWRSISRAGASPKTAPGRLALLLAQMKSARARGDKQRFFTLSHDFHEMILAAAANATLRDQHRQLAGQVRRARFLSLGTGAEWDEALREHRSILDALRKRNGAAAVEAVARRLRTHKKKVLHELKQRAPA